MTSENFLQQLLTLPTVSHAVLSPDGRWVAFEWYRRHENLDVFLVPADGSRQPVALTHTPEATGLVRWAPLLSYVLDSHAGPLYEEIADVDAPPGPFAVIGHRSGGFVLLPAERRSAASEAEGWARRGAAVTVCRPWGSASQ